MNPDETHRLAKLQTGLKDIKNWKSSNFSLLNSDKTAVIVLGLKHIRDSLSNNIINLDDIALASRTPVRNLGIIFDQELSFNSRVKHISRTAFFYIRNIDQIWHILSQRDAGKLAHALVTSG